MGNELASFRLVIHARTNPSGTYTYVIVRSDNPYWTEMGTETFTTVEEAAEAGRLAIDRLEAVARFNRLPDSSSGPTQLSES
jgi:hypothetical protein